MNLTSAAALLGRKGGKSRSEAKRKAAAENGKKGGRPKGSKVCDTMAIDNTFKET